MTNESSLEYEIERLRERTRHNEASKTEDRGERTEDRATSYLKFS
jgi:hypothetical protein